MTRVAMMVPAVGASALRALNYSGQLCLRSSSTGFERKRLRDLLSDMGASYWSIFKRLDCEPEHGVELLSQTDLFASEPQGRVIRRDSMPKPESHIVRKWQILVAGAGQMNEGNLFGRSIIADGRLSEKYLGPHVVALTFSEEGGDDNLWTYAYLNTAHGVAAVKSCAFGTSVPGLRLDLMRKLTVPVPTDIRTKRRVANFVRECVAQRERYLTELKAARAVIESLPEMQEAHAMCAERKAHAVMWDGPIRTGCAWNYSSAGEALPFLRRKWATRVSDLLPNGGLFYGARSSRVSCTSPHGVDFVSQRDAFLIRPIPRRVVLPGIAPEMLGPPEEGFYLAARGTLGEGELFGNPALVAGRLRSCTPTEDLLRVVPKPDRKDELFAFLSTLVGLRLVRSCAVGTKILNLRFDLLRALPAPELAPQARANVSAKLAAAVDARNRSDSAEAEAIRIVEEEVLPAWVD